ncbi:MAG: PP2C family protein-serine/threonine phosphatase [Planctomycetota bacterium]|nr:PP2C family protein-serine/threonine phosphatase [Planctomycetota bacterium]
MTHNPAHVLFGSEYEQELEVWIQRRFRYLCIAYLGLGIVYLILRIVGIGLESGIGDRLIGIGSSILSIVIVIYFLTLRNWKSASRDLILLHASRMILIIGATSILTQLILVWRGASFDNAQMLPRLFFWHITACLFLPWTPRESLRPMIPLLILWIVCVLAFNMNANFIEGIITSIFGPGVVIPGLGICSWRLSRHSLQFRREMVGQHFMSMRQELMRARNIHESMFPQAYDDGHVQFEYTYLPMRELGGDFIHLSVAPQGLVYLTLLDVTGHGLAAALTVNRLFGELERIRGELPLAEPDEVLILLNRYINLTMVKHNIYATAACVTLDPYLSELRWAAAGHPPGFLRQVSGAVVTLEATTVVLGALSDEEFSTELQVTSIRPGEELIIYTDGVIEAKNRANQQYGLKNLRELMLSKPPPRNWPQYVTSAIQKYSGGKSEDDILVASLRYLSSRQDEHITDEIEAAMRSRTLHRVAEELE